MTTVNWVALAIGLVLTAWSVWERAGRSRNSRAWMRQKREREWRTTLFVKPGFGILGLVVGLYRVFGGVPVVGYGIAFLAVVVLVLTFWWGILQFPCPQWAIPGYARDEWNRRNAERPWQW